jgi:hypothetical protein
MEAIIARVIGTDLKGLVPMTGPSFGVNIFWLSIIRLVPSISI